MTTSLAVVGDFDPSGRTHAATNDAIGHCSAALGLSVQYCWLGTEELAGPDGLRRLASFDGIWIAPGSPYRSMEGALAAIRAARERQIPLLGTCGGLGRNWRGEVWGALGR